MFSVPEWLRNVGLMAWLLVGITIFVLGLVTVAALTQVIVVPVITAAVVAAVASPLVRWLHARGLPRGLAAALVLVGFIVLAIAITVMVVAGITGESGAVSGHLSQAKDTISGWLQDIGMSADSANAAKDDASAAISDSVGALLNGLVSGLLALSSIGFFLAMTILSLFFLLKDGPVIRGWVDSHVGLPLRVAQTISGRVLQSLRGYFLGVTIVAAFNAGVVALGCLILGVPLIGTIAAVTFVGAYIPYIGAWGSAAFAVLIALGAEGPEAAGALIVVELLANGLLQQMVQPFAMGVALGIHPLAVLVVTIAGGALFGGVGLILAAPLTAAGVKIGADLRRARAEADRPAPPPSAEPAPAL